MSPFRSTFFQSCGQVLCLLLAIVVGVQGLPVHTLVQSLQSSHAHHECAHSEGYCPMNPDGPCRCDHNHSDVPDEPTFQSCGSNPSSAVLTATSPKWRPSSAETIPAPRTRPLVHVFMLTTLSSQRTGDDVFHPPRVQANLRPGSTLQAPHFA